MSGRIDCAGRHQCEPETYPESLDEEWTCPECGTFHRAFDVHAETPVGSATLRHVPIGTFGWTTRARVPSMSEGEGA